MNCSLTPRYVRTLAERPGIIIFVFLQKFFLKFYSRTRPGSPYLSSQENWYSSEASRGDIANILLSLPYIAKPHSKITSENSKPKYYSRFEGLTCLTMAFMYQKLGSVLE